MMNDDELSVFRTDVRARVLPHVCHKPLKSQVADLIDNARDIRNGRGSRKRSLFVIGRSGTGKSFALETIFREFPELQARVDKDGRVVCPLMSIEAEPGGMVTLCNLVSKKLGLPENHTMKPNFAYGLLKSLLREYGVYYLHVDEAQHLLRHQTPFAIQQLQDQLKLLVQNSEWPLQTIYSGVENLAALLGTPDDQLANRAHVRRFGSLVLPDDEGLIDEVLVKTAVEFCGLVLDDDLRTADFRGRLWQASSAAFGTVIENVQEASFIAVKNEHPVLGVRHFARYYERHTGCLPQENVFTEKIWTDIDRRNAVADLLPPKRNRKAKK